MVGRLKETIDRWGPGAVAVITLLAMIALQWQTDVEIAKLKGQQSVVMDCSAQQFKLEQRVNSLEQSIHKDREDWEFAVAKLENFEKVITKVLIHAKLME